MARTTRNLNVPSVRQIHPTICWAACVEMVAKRTVSTAASLSTSSQNPVQKIILKTYIDIISADLVNRPEYKKYCTKMMQTDSPDLRSEFINMMHGWLDNFCKEILEGVFGLDSTMDNYQEVFLNSFGIPCDQFRQNQLPDFNFFKQKIDGNRPVLVGLRYPGVSGSHAIVVTGYSDFERKPRHL